MITKLVYLSISVAGFALVFGFALRGGPGWAGASACGVIGALWVLGYRQGWKPVCSVGLGLYVAAAALGTWFGAGPGWMLAGVLAALAAWDLGLFAQRLRSVDRILGQEDMQRRHLLRLLLAEGAGLLLAVAALLLRLQLRFLWLIVLGIVALVGLTQAIGPLRRESD